MILYISLTSLLFSFSYAQSNTQFKEDKFQRIEAENVRKTSPKTDAVKQLLSLITSDSKSEYQTYDGWYNNPWNPSLGSAESSLIRLLPPAYQGGIYLPANRSSNPFLISDQLMDGSSHCDGHQQSSVTGKNVMMAFFGQLVAEEILDTRRSSCPPGHFDIDIPEGHYFNKTGLKKMPFIRSSYDKKSGLASNNPRKQLNHATTWIDGSIIYGRTKSESDALRSFKNGHLAPNPDDPFYPASNDNYLTYLNPARNYKENKIRKDNFRLGNRLAHESPFLLMLNIIFFRWHNYLADSICDKEFDDDKCYNEARKWVVATLQNIILNEWLPVFLDDAVPEYPRYDPSIDPSISNSFQMAMRFGHTLVPEAIYARKKVGQNHCEESLIRLCDSFYNAQDILYNHTIDYLILGMTYQAAKREDNLIVSDLRRYMYGPPEFTRVDLMALNIQRGRDHGLPGYGHAYKMLFPKASANVDFDLLTNGEITKQELQSLYSTIDDVDLFVGGLLEADGGLGPVFKSIIREQFLRIRDGDRFWFQNTENGLFSEEQVKAIKKIKMYDVIVTVTQHIGRNDLPDHVFELPTANPEYESLTCVSSLIPYSCDTCGSSNFLALPPIEDSGMDCPSSVDAPPCHQAEPLTHDYFAGSESAYALSFLFLFLFILGCIVALFVLVQMRKKEATRLRHSVKHQKNIFSGDNSCLVTEWIGKNEGFRDVMILFAPDKKQLSVCLLKKQVLRTIDFKPVQMVDLHVSVGGHLHYVLMHIAREYDLVLKFESLEEKNNFVEKLETFLGKIGIGRQRYESTVSHMLRSAVTKADRQVQLEKFFRCVFGQAFSINKDELMDIDYNQAKEIVKVELTAYEFAEALSLRPDALFVKQMFALIDADGNGYISFREFLNVIVIFSKGSPEDKIKLMFDMYDIDRSGKLSRQEFSDMIRSMLELANQSLSPTQLDELTEAMFPSCGLQNKQEMTFADFSNILADHREELGYVQLSFNVGEEYKTTPQANRKSVAMRAEETVVRAYSILGEPRAPLHRKKGTLLRVETKPMIYESDPTKQKVNKIIRFIENYKPHIFWTILYTLIMFGIFIQKAYYYSVEAEHNGLRRIAGLGVTITRGAASAMMFAFATILLTMCRNTITFLRETFFHKYIPFDAAIAFHKYIACWALFFSIFHATGHAINFYHIATQTMVDLVCLFPNFHLDPQNPRNVSYWLFQTITGITGIFLVILMSLMYVFAVQFSRRHVFNAFWKTHNLYPILYILMILHGVGFVIQGPIFYHYLLFPCCLFTVDMLISVSRKKVEISVVKAELLPSAVTHLEFKKPDNFEYKSGQWVRIACVPLNKNEYHPFTLSSAPHEENLSLHIRAVGPWTTNLRNIYDPNNLQQHAYPKIYLDGPFGEGHQDWFRYDVSVLVGGGIGITPFASILKDIVFKSSLKHKIFCKKLYFIWVTRSQKQFEWMIDIIQEVEKADKDGLVDVHIFITQFYQKFDLRTTMLYICERHFQRVCGRSLFTGLRSKTHFGRPDFDLFFNSLRQEHSDVSKIAVFSCGPPLMTRSVQLSCDELNKHEGAIFVHHYENF